MNAPAPDRMAAARAAKAQNLAAKRQQIEALKEEQARRQSARAKEPMEMEPSWSEESSIDEPPPVNNKRKRERQIISEPFVASPPPSSKDKRPRVDKSDHARQESLPSQLSWSEHAANAIYGAAPVVGQCVLLFAGLMVTLAANTKVEHPKSNVPEYSAPAPPQNVENMWMPPPTPTRSVNDYSLL